MQYLKPPISIQDQIKLLKRRGLKFDDENIAAHCLSNISFYRLRAYTYPFQDNSNPQHQFIKPVSFSEITDLYLFDRKLRLLVFDALEKIEIALRTKIIYTFSIAHGSHWYENPLLYRDNNRFIRDLNKVYEEIDRSNETFIDHYKNKYTQPTNPPAWMTLEVTSLGLLSKLFQNLKKGTEKKTVSASFGLPNPEILESWMHAFAHLRNICAHHGRLWNRRLTTTPRLPTNPTFPFLQNRNVNQNKLYTVLSCITYTLQIVSNNSDFNREFKKLISSCSLLEFKEMGIPASWDKEIIWK